MNVWSVFTLADGMFTGVTLCGLSEEHARASAGPGCDIRAGDFDHLSQRVDLESGGVVDYMPECPGADYEFIERRWSMTPAAAARQRRVTQINAELAAIDLKLIRALGELADDGYLEPVDKSKLRARVTDLNIQKGTLRAELSQLRA